MFYRLSNKDHHDAEGDLDLEVSRGDHQPDGYYNDEQQPICQDGRRSPRRWFLPSPQGATAEPCSLISCRSFETFEIPFQSYCTTALCYLDEIISKVGCLMELFPDKHIDKLG